MEDSKVLSELVKALHGIQDELQQVNKNLSAIAAKSGQSTASSEARPAGRPAMGRPTGRPPTRSPRTGGYGRTERSDSRSEGRSEMSGGPATGDKESSRFPKRKASPSRPKGKLPAKKGDGYPKKR